MKTLLIAAVTCVGFSAAAWSGPLAFAGGFGGKFGILDLGTGGFTELGTGPASLVGLGYSDGNLYGLDSSGALKLVDPSNGTALDVGNVGFAATAFTSLYDSLYAVDDNWNLFSIDPSNASANPVGPIKVGGNPLPARGPYGYADTLAGGLDSLLFTLDLWTTTPGDVLASKLYSVDPFTGTATVIGPTGQEDLAGSAFIDGTLYAFTGSFSTPKNKIFTLDTSTGAATFTQVVVSSAPALYGAAVSNAASVPEPATFAFAGSVLAAILIVRRRNANRR